MPGVFFAHMVITRAPISGLCGASADRRKCEGGAKTDTGGVKSALCGRS